MRRNFFKAVGGVVDYLLRTTFPTAGNQLFTDGQVLDTEAEGILDGSLKYSSGIVPFRILSGELLIDVGATAGAWSSGSLNTIEQYTMQDGFAFSFSDVTDVGIGKGPNYMFGLITDNTTQGLANQEICIYLLGNDPNGTVYAYGKSGAPVTLLKSGIEWDGIDKKIVCVVDKTNNELFVYYSTSTTYELIGIVPYTFPSNAYIGLSEAAAFDCKISRMLVPDKLYLDKITGTVGDTGFTFEGID